MSDEFWKKTLDIYTGFIEKPKMNDKLLKKPPPKYVFDIIVNTMKVTNFNQGLYSDNELDGKVFEAVSN